MNKKLFFAVVFLSSVITAVWAQESEIKPPVVKVDTADIDRSNATRMNSYGGVLEKAMPSVVSVYTGQRVAVVPRPRSMEEEMYRRVYGYNQSEISSEERPLGMGSGVIVSADGYIVTNNHVVRDPNKRIAQIIMVKLDDGSQYEGKVIATDPQSDLALLKIEADSLPFITFADSSKSRIGDVVFAIGNPLGIGKTVTSGIISALNRSELGLIGENSYEDFIQVDAAINQGNSGGALIDSYGRLIGINTAIVSPSGGSIGIGFAIPSNIVQSVMNSLVTHGEVRRNALGISMEQVLIPRNEADNLGLSGTTAVAIRDILGVGSAAECAGLRPNDIILEVEGKDVSSPNILRLRLAEFATDATVKLRILRGKDVLEVAVTFSADKIHEIFTGVLLMSIPDARQYIQIPKNQTGIVIASVTGDSPYSSGLVAGMIIYEINGEKVSTQYDLRNALKKGVNNVSVWYRGATHSIQLRY